MKNWSILTAMVSLPEQSTAEAIVVTLPDNAIPVGLEIRSVNQPNSILLHYLIPSDDKGVPLCEICNERPADFEGVICVECKGEQDELNLLEERRSAAKEMVETNHKGEQCWIDPKRLCEEGWCSGCQIFLDWKEKYGV